MWVAISFRTSILKFLDYNCNFENRLYNNNDNDNDNNNNNNNNKYASFEASSSHSC
jgi:hypothetical protein